MIAARERPEFQNPKDSHRQLQEQLLSQSRLILLILDDGWSRANLEKQLIEEAGYKTLVAITDGSTIPSNNGTRLYHFRLVRENDALSLFCFWVLGQTSIPCMSDANLVKEVQAEWKGLLLALNGVIGSSLHGEPLVTWKSARKKLSKELLSNCHTGGFLGCLETSIDFLDDVAKVWFSDLARFPDEKKNCENASLDIWVYIQKLKRPDALVIVLELTRKNFFNLRDNPRAAVSSGSALELYFSQKYVMREAPLDIWVYIQKLKQQDALVIVLELTRKNFFNLRDIMHIDFLGSEFLTLGLHAIGGEHTSTEAEQQYLIEVPQSSTFLKNM